MSGYYVANRRPQIELDERCEDLLRHFERELVERDETPWNSARPPTHAEVITSLVLSVGHGFVESVEDGEFDVDDALEEFEEHRDTQYESSGWIQEEENVPVSYLETASWDEADVETRIENAKVHRRSEKATETFV